MKYRSIAYILNEEMVHYSNDVPLDGTHEKPASK